MGVVLVGSGLLQVLAAEAAVQAVQGQEAVGAALGQAGSKVWVEQAAVGPEQELRPAQSLVAE
jgi:hypothetical protein